jgi:hypothetical protein
MMPLMLPLTLPMLQVKPLPLLVRLLTMPPMQPLTLLPMLLQLLLVLREPLILTAVLVLAGEVVAGVLREPLILTEVPVRVAAAQVRVAVDLMEEQALVVAVLEEVEDLTEVPVQTAVPVPMVDQETTVAASLKEKIEKFQSKLTQSLKKD